MGICLYQETEWSLSLELGSQLGHIVVSDDALVARLRICDRSERCGTHELYKAALHKILYYKINPLFTLRGFGVLGFWGFWMAGDFDFGDRDMCPQCRPFVSVGIF